MAEVLEKRVSKLEKAHIQFTKEMRQISDKLSKSNQILHIEMRDFKDEMRDFKDEMRDFKDEMRDFKDEMLIYKDTADLKIEELRASSLKLHIEMRDFKDEMRIYKDTADLKIGELHASHKKMNEQWGNLANKMGTLVEDIIFPNMLTIAEKYFGCPPEPEDMYMRRYRRNRLTNKKREFDVITIYTDKVIINETKTTVSEDYIDAFFNVLSEINNYLPEFNGLEIIPVMASLYVKQDIVAYASQKNIYIMAMAGGYMSIINPDLNATKYGG